MMLKNQMTLTSSGSDVKSAKTTLTLLDVTCFKMQIETMYLIVLGFNDTSTLEGHFVSSPREREKRDRRELLVEEMKERDREERGTGMKVKKQKK